MKNYKPKSALSYINTIISTSKILIIALNLKEYNHPSLLNIMWLQRLVVHFQFTVNCSRHTFVPPDLSHQNSPSICCCSGSLPHFRSHCGPASQEVCSALVYIASDLDLIENVLHDFKILQPKCRN